MASVEYKPVRLIGVGSHQGDDRVGWLVAEQVASAELPGVNIVAVSSPIGLLDHLGDIRRLIVCDAFSGPGPVGSLRYWDWPSDELCCTPFAGSHDVSLAAALQLGDRLGLLPRSVGVWGIDIGPSPDLAPGGGNADGPALRSAALRSALPAIVKRLGEVLGRA